MVSVSQPLAAAAACRQPTRARLSRAGAGTPFPALRGGTRGAEGAAAPGRGVRGDGAVTVLSHPRAEAQHPAGAAEGRGWHGWVRAAAAEPERGWTLAQPSASPAVRQLWVETRVRPSPSFPRVPRAVV